MLTIKNLTKKYGQKTILKDVNINVNKNEILGIVGPSGAGKTTLLRCITGLDSANSGTLLLNNRPFKPLDRKSNDTIGMIFQDYQLFPNLTILENLTLAPSLQSNDSSDKIKQQAKDLMKDLNLQGRENYYPYQLSGGQKQRVAIARALMMKPKILCYDEPTSALDPKLVKVLAKLMLKLKQRGITQIVVSHDIPFAKDVSDQLLNIKKFSQVA